MGLGMIQPICAKSKRKHSYRNARCPLSKSRLDRKLSAHQHRKHPSPFLLAIRITKLSDPLGTPLGTSTMPRPHNIPHCTQPPPHQHIMPKRTPVTYWAHRYIERTRVVFLVEESFPVCVKGCWDDPPHLVLHMHYRGSFHCSTYSHMQDPVLALISWLPAQRTAKVDSRTDSHLRPCRCVEI